jgi:hypothetical protein
LKARRKICAHEVSSGQRIIEKTKGESILHAPFYTRQEMAQTQDENFSPALGEHAINHP